MPRTGTLALYQPLPRTCLFDASGISLSLVQCIVAIPGSSASGSTGTEGVSCGITALEGHRTAATGEGVSGCAPTGGHGFAGKYLGDIVLHGTLAKSNGILIINVDCYYPDLDSFSASILTPARYGLHLFRVAFQGRPFQNTGTPE